jgi:hypothetical protein
MAIVLPQRPLASRELLTQAREFPAQALQLHAPALPGLSPALLEYRADIDPDVEYIPKTVAGFAMGALAMGLSADVGETILSHPHETISQLLPGLAIHFAFMLGIIGVSSSLLLVGLKVRADHASVPLFARHWLTSIGNGAFYALMVWGPWLLINHSIMLNRFLAAAIWMAIMAYPAICARWIIGPQRVHTVLE